MKKSSGIPQFRCFFGRTGYTQTGHIQQKQRIPFQMGLQYPPLLHLTREFFGTLSSDQRRMLETMKC